MLFSAPNLPDGAMTSLSMAPSRPVSSVLFLGDEAAPGDVSPGRTSTSQIGSTIPSACTEASEASTADSATATRARSRAFGRLRSNALAVARSPSEVQLGLDERWSVRISGLTPAESEWLLDLANRRHVPAITAARRYDLDPDRVTDLVTVLGRAGYWQYDRLRTKASLRATADGAADIGALGALRGDNFGKGTLVRRSRVTVAVLDSGRLGAAICRHLATAGIGTLLLPDLGMVEMNDLGLGGYQRAEVGRRRLDCLMQQIRRCSSTRTVHDGVPDVVVAIDQDVVRPRLWTRLMGEALPHLVVVAGEADVTVGPFVQPGATACLNCFDLHQTDADPAWPNLKRQLLQLPRRSVETTLAASAAAVAAAQVLAHVDGLRPATSDGRLRLALPQAIPTFFEAPPHRECGCRSLRQASKPGLSRR